MFIMVAWIALSPGRLPTKQQPLAWLLISSLFIFFIGLRHEVGADWLSYLGHFETASTLSFTEALKRGDPGHYGLNNLIARLGGNIYWVNLIYAAIVMWGTTTFCRKQPRPWLALLVATPYMLIVVGMGYSRQAVALGFCLVGLVALADNKIRKFILMVTLGALFHKSAVLLLPIAALAASRNRILTASLVAVTFSVLYLLLVSDDSDHLWNQYVELERHSQGAKIRVLMNSIPAAIFMIFSRKLTSNPQEKMLWTWISIMSLACIPLVGFATTAVDRVALYFIPIQIFVFSRIPLLANQNKQLRTLLVVSIVAYYAATLFVWLNFSTHSEYWVPYESNSPL